MKVLVKDKISNSKDIRCDCNHYLFTIRNTEIFIKCKRCKKDHKVLLKIK